MEAIHKNRQDQLMAAAGEVTVAAKGKENLIDFHVPESLAQELKAIV